MDILYLIVARGGSKGVPGKNLRRLAGLSLVGFKARSAQRARHRGRLVISTDCPAIQEEARALGVEVPFTRPAELATDTASSVDVVLHAMRHFETVEGRAYDAVMLLEPSSPFARAADYDAGVELFRARHAKFVTGVRACEVNSVFCGPLGPDGSIAAIAAKLKDLARLRRQDLGIDHTPNGAFYLVDWAWFREARHLYAAPEQSYGVAMDRFHSIEIDTPIDLAFAEYLAEKGHLDLTPWL